MDMAGSLRDGKNGPFTCDGKALRNGDHIPFIYAKLAFFMDDESSFKGNERSLHVDDDFAAKDWYFLKGNL